MTACQQFRNQLAGTSSRRPLKISQSQTTVFVGQWMERDSLPPCRKVQHWKLQNRQLHALWNRVWLTHDGTSAGTRDVLNLRKKEIHFIIGGYQLHTTVPKYTSTRSVYPLHGWVPRYDVHEKQLTSTSKAKGFVTYPWSEIPRLWISNPSKRGVSTTLCS